MKRFYLMMLICSTISICANAQIGYQVSLLNNATGEARANERVTVTVKITDSEGKIVCEETKNETSNDFGVVSMSVGNSDTFANADWSKLPFFIEASVDGRLLGKSQLLSVPVAEYAKNTGTLTKDMLCAKEWVCNETGYLLRKYSFNQNNSVVFTFNYDTQTGTSQESLTGIYEIEGNTISIYIDGDDYPCRYGIFNSIRNILMIINTDVILPYKQ